MNCAGRRRYTVRSFSTSLQQGISALRHSRACCTHHSLTVKPRSHMSSTVDFAALRREREARLINVNKKRDRSISPPATSRKATKIEASTATLPSGAKLVSFTSTVRNEQRLRKTPIANEATEKLKISPSTTSPVQDHSSRHGQVIYPHGVVKKTWAFGHDRTGDDIKLEEVLESQTLRIAVLSAFQWNTEWVLSKLRTPLKKDGTTKCIFVMQAKEASLRAQMQEDVDAMQEGTQWLRLCFPPMEGQTHCMHSKLMLLFHPDKLRVAVPTANLLEFDWGETGMMENSVFIIDLPRLPEGSTLRKEDLTSFGKELLYFLEKQGLDQDVRDGILKFDYAATKGMSFVHSIGGVSAGDEAQRSGLASLAGAVRHHGLQSDDVSIDFAASSIGSLKDAQLSLLHAAACGEDVFEFTSRSNNAKAANFFKQPTHDAHSIRDKFRIYFPTEETVQASKAGAAGTICLSRQWFEETTFPRRCFRDYISTRPGMLSHNKIMYVQSTQPKKIAWAYVGSANMSESAWGKLVYSKKDKTWHVNCRNWECGVLLPVEDAAASTTSDLSIFDRVVKPPFLYPGPAYDGRDPWYFKELH